MSGRSKAVLEEIAAGLDGRAAPAEVIVADASDYSPVTSRTRNIISTAGPFSQYSDSLVAACAQKGISYCDITGEAPWVKRVIERDAAAAADSGALITPMCGFDSVPSDLGTMRTCALLAAKGSATASVTAYMSMSGTMSGGTIATGLLMSARYPEEVDDVFLLGGSPAGGPRDVDADRAEAVFEDRVGSWVAPFGMSKINTRLVRRAAGLGCYANIDPGFAYQELQLAGSEKVAVGMARNAAIPPEVLKKFVDAGRLPKPSEGPSKEVRDASSFRIVFVGEGADGRTAATSMSGGDPGYDETAKMVSEACFALVEANRDTLPCKGKGGVYTPSGAFGDVLVDRLRAAGMSFEDDVPFGALEVVDA